MIRITQTLIIAILAFAAHSANATVLSTAQIAAIMQGAGVPAKQANQVANSLEGKRISAALYTHGLTGAFFYSTGNKRFKGVYANEAGELKTFHVGARFNNGGFVVGVEYRWLWVFLPETMTMNDISGAVCGRGVGLTLSGVAVLFGGVLPCENRVGTAFSFSIGVGAIEGIRFPKLTFETPVLN